MDFININKIEKKKEEYDKLVKSSPVIGFDDYTFKKIFNKHPDLLMKVIKLITGINFNLEDFEIGNNELKNGITLKSMICDIRILAKANDFQYEIDVESDQTRMKDDDMFDRAILSGAIMYCNLHDKGTTYRGNKTAIVILFLNNKYNESDADIEKVPLITSLITDYDNDIIIRTHRNIIIYSINVNSAVKNGFNINEEDGKILLEIVKVLSTKEIDKFLKSEDEVIRTMAEEIKQINDSKTERELAYQREFNELMNNFTINVYKREGYEEKELALKLQKQGYDVSYIAEFLETTNEKVEKYLAENK